jgi:hypothetical protein
VKLLSFIHLWLIPLNTVRQVPFKGVDLEGKTLGWRNPPWLEFMFLVCTVLQDDNLEVTIHSWKLIGPV